MAGKGVPSHEFFLISYKRYFLTHAKVERTVYRTGSHHFTSIINIARASLHSIPPTRASRSVSLAALQVPEVAKVPHHPPHPVSSQDISTALGPEKTLNPLWVDSKSPFCRAFTVNTGILLSANTS